MKAVDLCPRKVAAAYPLHRWRIPGTPAVGERRPVLVESVGLAERFEFADYAATPVHDGAEHVECQRSWACQLTLLIPVVRLSRPSRPRLRHLKLRHVALAVVDHEQKQGDDKATRRYPDRVLSHSRVPKAPKMAPLANAPIRLAYTTNALRESLSFS